MAASAPKTSLDAASLKRAILILGAAGFVFGPVLDGIHTFSGATYYANPVFLRSTLWCPPLFAGAALAIGVGRPLTRRSFGVPWKAAPASALVGSMVIFVVAYLLSGFLPAGWEVKTVVLGVFFAASYGLYDRSVSGLVLAALSGLGGWAVEYLLVHQGAFFHRDTQLWGVAGWIPFLYANGSITLGLLGETLLTQRSKATA